MDKSNVIGSSAEDAFKVLGRVADAFNNPAWLHKTDKEVLFVVNVVKSRRLLPSHSSEESVWQNTTCGSFDSSHDEEVEVVELGDSSYPYASRRQQAQKSFSARMFGQDDGMYDVTKMLLTSSPLDRLDRLARMELKKAGWFERSDKWSVVQLGLPGARPKSPPKNAVHIGESQERRSLSKTSRSPRGKLGRVVGEIMKRMRGCHDMLWEMEGALM